jgi:hypothetical protein
MAIIEVQAVEFIVHSEWVENSSSVAYKETRYDGYIKWRTEHRQTGRNMAKAWVISQGDEIDLTEEVLSGKVSFRAA